MSILAIDSQTFKWLQSLQIVKDGKRNSQNKIQLSQQASIKFFDGIMISKILKKIIENESQINQTLLTKMKSIKENSTPAIRLYNWNLIVDVLKYYKYQMDYVEKSKILNMQPVPIVRILDYLKGIYRNENGLTKGNDSSMLLNSSLSSSIKQSNNNHSSSNLKDTAPNPLQVDIKSVPSKSPTDATNILQLFVISLSKNFKLSPQQTLNLFLDNNKYLAHLLVKGIKDSFEPVMGFLNEIMANLQPIVLNVFAVDQEKSLEFFFQGLKGCLISKSLDVAVRCLTIFDRVRQIYVENKLEQKFLLNWFRKEGVNMLLFSSKRHEETLEHALMMVYKLMDSELFEFIRPTDKSPLWKDQHEKLQFYNSFLFVAENTILEAYGDSTCLIEWNKYCLRCLKKLKSITEQKLLITIMHRKWIQFPKIFQEDNGMSDAYITFLKGTSFSSDFMLFIDSIKTMFDLMSVLGRRKNSFAPIFYKTLINCLSFESGQERVTFIMDNFISVFSEIENLPGSLLVEPLLQSIERKCTTSSLQLGRLLVLEQKVKEEESSEIVDVMTKVFFEDVNQGALAIQYVFECLPALDQEVQNQFLLKNSQLCLAHFFSLSKSIKRTFPDLVQTLRKYDDDQILPREGNNNSYIAQVKKYLLIENLMKFIQKIIQQQYTEVVKQLEEAVFMTFVKVKIELNKQHIALILKNMILRRYDDVEEELVAVIDRYEQKFRAFVEAMRNKRRESIEQSDQDVILKENPVFQSRLHASKSLILDESPFSPQKKLKPDIFKPEQSALKDLQLLKSRMFKLKTITEENSKKNDIIQEKKDLVRSLINQRRLVRYGAKYNADVDYNCLFQFESQKEENKIGGMPGVEITDLQKEEEDIFVDDVDSLMKKYRKVWRFLFFKYSTFGAKNPSNDPKIQQKINMAQVWKMHRQYNADFIKKEQSFAIVKQVNDSMKRRHDLQNLTYLGFEEYIVQFCIWAYNKIGLSNLSPGQKVTKLIKQFKSVTEEKGGNVEIFQNPEEVYFLETDVIKEFNRRLAENHEYILPQGYKKIRQAEFVYEYEFTQKAKESLNDAGKKKQLNDSYFAVLQVLDMIFCQKQELGFHILQLRTTKTQKILAKPALFQQISQKMKNHKEGYLMPKRQINSTYIESRQKVNLIKPEFHPKVEFSLGIKLGLASVPLKHKYIGEEVAYWMDDMLDAIESGSPKVHNKATKQIENQAIKKKKQILFKLKHEMKEKQKMYKQRSQSVKLEAEKFQVVKQEYKKKRIQDMKSKRKQEKSRQQLQAKKKLAQFQKAKRYFSQKHQQQKEKTKKQQEVKKVEKEDYKKKVQEYFKLKKEQLQEKELNLKKQKEYEVKKQQQDKQKHIEFTKKVYFSVLKKDETTLQRIQTTKDKYLHFCTQPFVLHEFQTHRKSLTLLFQLLLKYQKSKISATDKNEISQSTFNFFSIKFRLVPFILEKNILARILLSIGKEQGSRGGGGVGISGRGFEEALLKVVVKAKGVLNQMVERRKRKKQQPATSGMGHSQLSSSQLNSNSHEQPPHIMNNNNSISNILQSSQLTTNSRLIINENLSNDYLFDPQGVTQQTIRQFMLFLNLPDDKLGIEQRWREAVEAKNNKPLMMVKKEMMMMKGE